MRYILILESDSGILSERVQEYIDQGFQPYGSPFASIGNMGTKYGQAVILPDDNAGTGFDLSEPYKAISPHKPATPSPKPIRKGKPAT